MVKLVVASAVPDTSVPPVTVIVGATVYPDPGLVIKFKAGGKAKPTNGATV